MKRKTHNTRKGQSAIEYLMTYGWMLLVVAIVGGAIFATVQGQCVSDQTGFTGDDAAVNSFVVGDSLELEVANTASEPITLQEVYVGDEAADATEEDIGVGDSTVVEVGHIGSEEGSCNDFDVSLQYQMGEFSPANATGSLTGEMAVQ